MAVSEEYKNHLDPFNAAADRVAAAQKGQVKEVETQEEEAQEAQEEIVNDATEEVDQSKESPAEEEISTESEPQNEEDTLEDDKASKEVVSEEDDVISDWDVSSEEDSEKEQFDYKSFARELGVDAESKEEFVIKVNELKAKAEAPDPLADLPENFRKAIDIARNDGDYLEFLGITSVNYDAVPDINLVQNHYSQVFRKADGSIDQEMLEAKLDRMDEADIRIEGETLKRQYKQAQAQKTANLEAEAARNREQADKALRAELDNLKEYNGFKFSPSHKKQLYDGITSGDMISKMFHGSDGKMDYKKVISAYSNYLYGEKQNKYLRQQIATKTKKEVLDRLSNKRIEPKGTPPNAAPKKELTGQQKAAEELREHGAGLFKH